LAAVAAASPETKSFPGTITCPNPDVRASSNANRPAILATERGEILFIAIIN
jgi:hypothetical protein